MNQPDNLEPNKLLDKLKEFSEMKNNSEPGYITFVLASNTNIKNEINYIRKHMPDRFSPQIKSANKGAKKLIKILRDIDKEDISDTPILYLLDGTEYWSYSLPIEDEGTHRASSDHKFQIDWVISKLEKVVKKENRIKEKENQKQFREDHKRYESEEIDIYPGMTNVKKHLKNRANDVDKIYVLNDFEDEELQMVFELANKTGKEIIELNNSEILEGFGSIVAFSYFKDKKSLPDIKERDFKRIKDSKRFFNFYEKNLLDAYGKVDSIEKFVREDMEQLDQKIYYVVGKRGDGKTQSIEYLIRKYLKKLDDLRYFPVDCRLKIELDDNQNNIINFWKHVKTSFQDMNSNIKKDDELYDEIKDVNLGKLTFGKLLTSLEEELEEHQKERDLDDEEYVWKLIESLNELGFNGILLFIDELDKPDFKSVVKNFLNHNQHLFTKLFENNCYTFICAKPDWFKHIHEDSDLNFYTGKKLPIKQVISVEQCRSLIEKRFDAFNLETPLYLPDEGYKIILQTGKRRRQIIEKYMELYSYSQKEGKNTLSIDEIKSVLTTIEPQTKEFMIDKIRSSSKLYDISKQLHKSGETYLDAIDFVFKKGEDSKLHYIQNDTKVKLIDKKLKNNNFEVQEFKDSWDWMKGVGIIDNQRDMNKEFKEFLNDILNELGDEENIDSLYTVQDILREIIAFFEKENYSNNMQNHDVTTNIDLPSKDEISQKAKHLVSKLTGIYGQKNEYQKKLSKLSRESRNREALKEKLKDMVVTSKVRDGYQVKKKYPNVDEEQHRTLEKDWMLQLYSDLKQKTEESSKDDDELLEELQKISRKEILDGLSEIYDKHGLGNIAFNPDGLFKTFDQLKGDDKDTFKHFFNPPKFLTPRSYIDLIYETLKIINSLDEKLTFSPDIFLEDNFVFSPIEQYKDLKSLFKNDRHGFKLIDEFYRFGKFYILNDEQKFNDKKIEPLLDMKFLHKGVIKECSNCNNDIIMGENSLEVYHPSCGTNLSKFDVKNEVLYITNPDDIDLLFLLRFIYSTDIFDKVLLSPKFDGKNIHVDAICLKDRKMIGLKTVSSARNVRRTEKKYPDIFSKVWYIKTKEIQGDPGDVVFVPESGDFKGWTHSELKEIDIVSAKKIKKYLQR